ncbi:mucin-like protein isoform X2 [Pecten maximus]|uniref:mucin-like protein isoform X2 n=1 Tax=Pecten maximus TaxID=6579 RepID=UPI00145910F5|nr:mucin-like protein isoform X2 [Pecten maximus]
MQSQRYQEDNTIDSSYAVINRTERSDTTNSVQASDNGTHNTHSLDSTYASINPVQRPNNPEDVDTSVSIVQHADVNVSQPGFSGGYDNRRNLPIHPQHVADPTSQPVVTDGPTEIIAQAARPTRAEPRVRQPRTSRFLDFKRLTWSSPAGVVVVAVVLVLILLGVVAVILYVTVFKEDNSKQEWEWTDWENWSTCSKTSGNGIKTRNRTCDNCPQNNDKVCDGPHSETSFCCETTCPVICVWSEWSVCSCDKGVSTRRRECNNATGEENIEADSETKLCWSCWGEWSRCSFTCGSGIRTRNRTCNGKFSEEECGWELPTFRDTGTCENHSCTNHFCEGKIANCSYKHPHRCDTFITCEADDNMHERVCNVKMRYRVDDDDECEGYCDWERKVKCSSDIHKPFT